MTSQDVDGNIVTKDDAPSPVVEKPCLTISPSEDSITAPQAEASAVAGESSPRRRPTSEDIISGNKRQKLVEVKTDDAQKRLNAIADAYKVILENIGEDVDREGMYTGIRNLFVPK